MPERKILYANNDNNNKNEKHSIFWLFFTFKMNTITSYNTQSSETEFLSLIIIAVCRYRYCCACNRLFLSRNFHFANIRYSKDVLYNFNTAKNNKKVKSEI